MQALLKLSRGIDAFMTWIGRWISWLILIAVIISSVNATVRKIFDVSSNAYLELQWVLFSVVFLMFSLDQSTWLRLLIWSLIGISIYFLYSAKNSKLNKVE